MGCIPHKKNQIMIRDSWPEREDKKGNSGDGKGEMGRGNFFFDDLAEFLCLAHSVRPCLNTKLHAEAWR